MLRKQIFFLENLKTESSVKLLNKVHRFQQRVVVELFILFPISERSLMVLLLLQSFPSARSGWAAAARQENWQNGIIWCFSALGGGLGRLDFLENFGLFCMDISTSFRTLSCISKSQQRVERTEHTVQNSLFQSHFVVAPEAQKSFALKKRRPLVLRWRFGASWRY